MEYSLWISLLLLVFIFPMKSESSDDYSREDEEGYENDSTTKSPEDNNGEDDKYGSENGSTKSGVTVRKTDQGTTTTIQTRSDGMEMAQSGQNGFKHGQNETNIAVEVGVPVALLGLVIVLGIIRLVSSGQLKNRVLGLRRIFGKSPENLTSLYTTNGFSSGNGTSETIFNPTYAMKSSNDIIQSKSKPPAGYGLDNMEQGIYVYDNPEMQKNDPDSTYHTINDGQLDSSYADFVRTNGHPPAIPQKQYGETAYDNNYI
ncbi:hypothetical protein CHS0354_013528 [Potamilus streckersoni]|uniref:Uncharacterized protein n=1 Tax=Potamilus streckersoni TaxID=2493646 RepID=A0AAE0W963_9BIVA|nr:hypothetical protein CHS0354_013528 [Potamilus streckersoni]